MIIEKMKTKLVKNSESEIENDLVTVFDRYFTAVKYGILHLQVVPWIKFVGTSRAYVLP